ncbi:MAG: hypothetical protein A3C27_00635 [Candidatus Levybacteria bacterium RIFCSPHIGHO2_02_FULL_39_36]|nr:MAG: hypothetical protein UT20_C0001G0044 [Candidatus Levybacteria bacterium GW2011_GWA1_39_11]KKR25335.1 MAG: hypothetical protein UT56_C0001G0066 [Candidatus Levybacteria bacterium GW2011_GWB1_39_7]OGH14495.1 MAG: hypothetical protein A2689_00510 [Candidatus Levybacteria bacterium RIFCSPHIGHO2_01_FULL_38_96]OGH25501.1 MAG: hypothetical protein A3E68_02365 [Candidatus Levybacteria bacterium RIFCSPHIGHO2_12_FULL_39_39]OGH28882.1 MAG: hypothetical protein A3C27_00635 [Candidatus Levybacteria 
MSPEIIINEKLIADLPDKTGTYPTQMGDIKVDMSLFHPTNQKNEIVLSGNGLKGRVSSSTENGIRRIQLNRKGKGSQELKGGEELTVKLHDPSIVKKPVKPRQSTLAHRYKARAW